MEIKTSEQGDIKIADIFDDDDTLLFSVQCGDKEIEIIPINFTHYPKPEVNGNVVNIKW